jgi:hypothetical protein
VPLAAAEKRALRGRFRIDHHAPVALGHPVIA